MVDMDTGEGQPWQKNLVKSLSEIADAAKESAKSSEQSARTARSAVWAAWVSVAVAFAVFVAALSGVTLAEILTWMRIR